MQGLIVNNSASTNSLKVNHSESKLANVFSNQIKTVKNISSPLLLNHNIKSEVITIGTPKEIKTPSLSTFSPKNTSELSGNILGVKNKGVVHDNNKIVRNYHFSKEQDVGRQNNIKDESKSNEYAKKRNEEVANKLNSYREHYSTTVGESDNKSLDNRYSLNSSDFSIIKNKIENKDLSKKEKMSIIKKYLQNNDSVMKKIGFLENFKNIFGKSSKINEIQREQRTDALNILNRLSESKEVSMTNK
ncbi:hypothetical protein [Proteus terrae]|uniref:hypothetical protein n=1 Tax=Proteus terrae TaxID=1574161 RepID=UPI0035248C00